MKWVKQVSNEVCQDKYSGKEELSDSRYWKRYSKEVQEQAVQNALCGRGSLKRMASLIQAGADLETIQAQLSELAINK